MHNDIGGRNVGAKSQRVRTDVTVEHIVPITTIEDIDVVAPSAIGIVVARVTRNRIGAIQTFQAIVSGCSEECIRAAITANGIQQGLRSSDHRSKLITIPDRAICKFETVYASPG